MPPGAGEEPTTRRRRVAERVRRWTRGRPHLLVALGTLATAALAWVGAFALRYELDPPGPAQQILLLALPSVLLVKCAAFGAGGVFRILWVYVGLQDLAILFRATLAASLTLGILAWTFADAVAVPLSLVVLDGVLTFLGVGGYYALLRFLREESPRREPRSAPPERILIVGAGDTGDTLLRELQRNVPSAVHVAGFVDDDPEKEGRLLRGVPVLGGLDRLREIAGRAGVRKAFIAVPRAAGAQLRRLVTRVLDAGLEAKILPPVGTLSSAGGFLPQLRNVSIDDLLRRPPVSLDEGRIAELIRGRTVLVTGAAGSIGSELCRQIVNYDPARLVALDWAETPLHDILLRLASGAHERRVVSELADVTDGARVAGIFDRHRPEIVFHAAALKHVPMCEWHVREALRVNVGGTRAVADAALRAGTSKVVLISTDKAVNPSSLMGATKRVAELLLQRLHRGSTRFCAVRFGNVLGSNGSVVPVFKAQLERGGPLTVTHPDMRRYFMTIPEAVQLVLQAAVLGRGGEVFELDMGEPVRIVDLAEDLIRLAGLVPGRDVRIEFTGVRPGEKLFEELYLDSEKLLPTGHPKVFCLKGGDAARPDPAVRMCLERLRALDAADDPVLARLREEIEGLLYSETPAPAVAA
ncbi:MAG TPA: nucleoside-diphosphate sugar epimerase/dehydratase [Planctomycetota bacterium]|nr:nucleoside-diphosphate sugar epimerase/dehydratase [Planctomycetota bacterium]